MLVTNDKIRLTSKNTEGKRQRKTKAAAAWVIKYTKLNNMGEQKFHQT